MKTLKWIEFGGKNYKVEPLPKIDAPLPEIDIQDYRIISGPFETVARIEFPDGLHSPRQQLEKGKKTVFRYVSGNGSITYTKKGQKPLQIPLNPHRQVVVLLKEGDIFEVSADASSKLVFDEFYDPAYEDGHYIDLD